MILLTEGTYGRLREEAVRARPEEACGILAGRTGKAQDFEVVQSDASIGGVRELDYPPPDAAERDRAKRVDRIFPCRNVDDQPKYRYMIDPSDQLEAFETIDAEDLDLIGFYHSHPRGPRGPSETDADRATWDDRSYLIISLDGDEPWIGSWVWREGEFVEERIVVTA